MTAALPCRPLAVENMQKRNVRMTIHYYTTVAAKGTSHWSMDVLRNRVTRHTTGYQSSPDARMPITIVTLQVGSKNDNEQDQHVARHPWLSSQPQNHPDPVLFVHFWSKPFNQHRGPRPKVHWYLCIIEKHETSTIVLILEKISWLLVPNYFDGSAERLFPYESNGSHVFNWLKDANIVGSIQCLETSFDDCFSFCIPNSRQDYS